MGTYYPVSKAVHFLRALYWKQNTAKRYLATWLCWPTSKNGYAAISIPAKRDEGLWKPGCTSKNISTIGSESFARFIPYCNQKVVIIFSWIHRDSACIHCCSSNLFEYDKLQWTPINHSPNKIMFHLLKSSLKSSFYWFHLALYKMSYTTTNISEIRLYKNINQIHLIL